MGIDYWTCKATTRASQRRCTMLMLCSGHFTKSMDTLLLHDAGVLHQLEAMTAGSIYFHKTSLHTEGSHHWWWLVELWCWLADLDTTLIIRTAISGPA